MRPAAGLEDKAEILIAIKAGDIERTGPWGPGYHLTAVLRLIDIFFRGRGLFVGSVVVASIPASPPPTPSTVRLGS